MDELSAKEHAKYTRLWQKHPEYRGAHENAESSYDYLIPIFLKTFQPKKGDRVLDFGCGTGRSAPFLLEKGLTPHLIDLTKSALDPAIYLNTLGETPPIVFTESSLWELPTTLEKATWMLSFDVLEHLPEENKHHPRINGKPHLERRTH
ncbi:MAG: hypothetical protein SP1CHLAM54_16900 [Chlamydiia bacterium]|nr:hypothetical protein [Chlamydiia bacterium]MCH9616578.1 hypothetical protein [Chlamydiia bacterium]MCH9629308.1 hypothetical protein [Chlamydiia bacterium]